MNNESLKHRPHVPTVFDRQTIITFVFKTGNNTYNKIINSMPMSFRLQNTGTGFIWFYNCWETSNNIA